MVSTPEKPIQEEIVHFWNKSLSCAFMQDRYTKEVVEWAKSNPIQFKNLYTEMLSVGSSLNILDYGFGMGTLYEVWNHLQITNFKVHAIEHNAWVRTSLRRESESRKYLHRIGQDFNDFRGRSYPIAVISDVVTFLPREEIFPVMAVLDRSADNIFVINGVSPFRDRFLQYSMDHYADEIERSARNLEWDRAYAAFGHKIQCVTFGEDNAVT